MWTRWPTAPKVVIYDNACNLYIYTHMRESWFFKDTKFIIDRLHHFAHKQCSPVFHFDLVAELYRRNSQLLEEFWGCNTSNPNRVGYMNQVNALYQMRHDIHNRMQAQRFFAR